MHTQLQKAIEQNSLVIFAGSGTSTVLGLPNWQDLTKDILRELEKYNTDLKAFEQLLESNTLSPLQVLDHLEHSYRPQILTSVTKKLLLSKSLNYSVHKKLYELSPKILTTNYDKAFEFSLEKQANIVTDLSKFKMHGIGNGEEYIFKIHGDIDVPENCVLFTSQYNKLYKEKDSAFLLELKKILTNKTILFIGFSLKDPFFIELLQKLDNMYNGFLAPHFIITTEESFNYPNDKIIPLKLQSYSTDKVISFLDDLIALKPITKLYTQKKEETVLITKPKISVLKSNPINKDFTINEEIIIEQLLKYDSNINLSLLNFDSLQAIDNSDLAFIITKAVKNKLIIEDEYLSGKQVTVDEIIENIPCTSLKCLIILHEGDFSCKVENKILPVILIKINSEKTKDVVTKFTYHFFVKHELPNAFQLEITCVNEGYLKFMEIKKGTGKLFKFQPTISKFIDQKNLQKFIGRKTDIESIVRKLIDLKYEDKLLTVKGSGGIGKTTIITKAAIEVAERKHFDKGVHFVPCQNIISFENFQFAISQCFDLISSIRIKEQIEENFSFKNRLIILDNFETLLHLPEREDIIDLTSFICDYSCIAVTTRQLLELDFEDVYDLRNFTTDEGVALFKSIYPKINPSDEKILRESIVEQLLNNNPLAIKLIAKGLPEGKQMTILKDELEENLFRDDNIEQIFERPEDINIEKSKSIYHSINYSYQKLSEKEKLTFELLSLFPDGIHLENFKGFSKNAKKSMLTVSDKDIKYLDNKSLLENSNNFLKLQSIISRFADYQFSKRDEDVKKEYYQLVFNFNSFMLTLIGKTKLLRSSDSLRFLDMSYNNLLKVFEIMEFIDEPINSKLNFIDDVSNQFRRTNQPDQFLKKLKKLSERFEGKEALLVKVMEYHTEYWTRNFDVIEKLVRKISPQELNGLNKEDALDELILQNAAAIYECEGLSYELLQHIINLSIYSIRIDHKLFKLGYLDEALWVVNNQKDEDDFGTLVIKLFHGSINVELIDEYIESLYKKEVLEICQCTYLKSQLQTVNLESIKKLVISNPYSHGIINLMQATHESSIERKREIYENALKHLFHIKYYYLEGILKYCSILEEHNYKEEFDKWQSEGLALAQQYHYAYLVFLFEKLKNPHLVWNQEHYIQKYAPLEGLPEYMKLYIKEKQKQKK